jgi:hypothetical protein
VFVGDGIDLKRGFLRLWALSSLLWVGLVVLIKWRDVEEYFTPPQPDPWLKFQPAYEPHNPILDSLVLGVSVPLAVLVAGFTISWIIRGFVSDKVR